MTQKIERQDTNLVQENRQLKNALNTLLDELEGDGQPDTSKVREEMPNNDRDKIKPPWEREGFENKDEWLAEKRPDHAGPD